MTKDKRVPLWPFHDEFSASLYASLINRLMKCDRLGDIDIEKDPLITFWKGTELYYLGFDRARLTREEQKKLFVAIQKVLEWDFQDNFIQPTVSELENCDDDGKSLFSSVIKTYPMGGGDYVLVRHEFNKDIKDPSNARKTLGGLAQLYNNMGMPIDVGVLKTQIEKLQDGKSKKPKLEFRFFAQ